MEPEYKMLLALLTDVISAHNEYLISREQDITDRELLIVKCKIALEYAESRREIANEVMEIFFTERKELRGMLEQNLDIAIKKGNVEFADLSLQMLELIFERNPLDVFKHTIRGE